MTWLSKLLKITAICGSLIFLTSPLQGLAQPWVEVGDRALRSDIEILAAHGLIEGLTTTWPIPAGQLKGLFNNERLQYQPEFVRRAAERVMAYLRGRQTVDGVADVRVTNSPGLVRDFGTLARDQADARIGADWNGENAFARVRVGAQTRFSGEQKVAAMDGTVVSAVWNNVNFYAGWVDQWYGPGWDSSLILSNNARPFPKIGFMRDNPTAFETPWLSWLGPWQVNGFIGLLDGPRVTTDTAMAGLRVTVEPIDGLEIALARMTEFCGAGHPCSPLNAAFHFRNQKNSVNQTNDEASIEAKGTINAGSLIISPYFQVMNEDNGPFNHADTSHLVGSSFAAPIGDRGAHWRVTTEYTDSVATLKVFGGTVVHGSSYNNAGYVDGFRYRGRTIGFSLDSDSRLASVIGMVTDSSGWTYRAAYRFAKISTPQLAAKQAGGGSFNAVTSVPVTINEGELGLSVPFHWGTVDFAVRGQDGLPTAVQGSSGEKLAAELGVLYRF